MRELWPDFDDLALMGAPNDNRYVTTDRRSPVGDRDADAVGKFGQGEATVEQQMIELHVDGHLSTSDCERLLFGEPGSPRSPQRK
jgi:hypothetical protein